MCLPRPAPRGRGRVSWEDEHDWDQTWHYRLRVVDASGHETIGAREATVTTPAHPAPEAAFPGPRAASRHPSAEALDDDAPMEPVWQWGAAFGTLLGAGLAGLRRRPSIG